MPNVHFSDVCLVEPDALPLLRFDWPHSAKTEASLVLGHHAQILRDGAGLLTTVLRGPASTARPVLSIMATAGPGVPREGHSFNAFSYSFLGKYIQKLAGSRFAFWVLSIGWWCTCILSWWHRRNVRFAGSMRASVALQ